MAEKWARRTDKQTCSLQKDYILNKSLSPYEEIDAKLDWSEKLKAQKKAEVKAIQEAAIRTDYNKKDRNWLTSAYYLEEAPSQASAGFRTYDQTHSDKQFFPLSDLQKSNSIITNPTPKLNPATSNLEQNKQIQTLESEEDWLKRLRRQRQRRGLF